MRIAILTLPLYSNYGGILQCYALQTVLERMGYEVRILSRPKYGILFYWIYPLIIFKRLFKRYILGKDIYILKAPHEIIRKNTDQFVDKYINKYKIRNCGSDIAKKFDAIVVGSDQVWRPEYFQPIEFAFLSFLGDSEIKRISYAASFGVDECEYTEEQLKVCSSFLKKFDAVSVRETSGVKLCSDYFGVNAVQMLDPTLLLSADDYRKLINNAETKSPKGNMLVYILDKTEEKIALVNRIAMEKGLTPFWLDSPDEQNEKSPLKERMKMSVEQWLRSFDEAEFVFTDSFHGCVFSIIFGKQFLVIGNKERGLSRFCSLLDMFSIKTRLLLSYEDYEKRKEELECCIDFDYIDSVIASKYNESMSFLSLNLQK